MNRHGCLSAASLLARGLSLLLGHWKLVLVAAFFLSPIGPHLRWSYVYRDGGGPRADVRCTYLGSRGFVTPSLAPDCPVIAILDSRQWRQ